MDGLVQIQVVVQGNAGAIGVVVWMRRGESGMANSREPKHPLATPSSGPRLKSVRSVILVTEVNPMTRTPAPGHAPRRILPAHLGRDGPNMVLAPSNRISPVS